MRTKLVAFSSLALVTVGLTTGASAETKYYAGAICQPTAGSEADIVYNANEVGEAANENLSLDRFVTCPVIHDDETNDDYLTGIYVHDGSCDESVECTAYIIDLTSYTVRDFDSDSTPAGLEGNDQLVISLTSVDPTSFFTINCELPDADTSSNCTDGAESYIRSIYVFEN